MNEGELNSETVNDKSVTQTKYGQLEMTNSAFDQDLMDALMDSDFLTFKEKTPDAIQEAFDSVALQVFKRLCNNFGLVLKPTTAYNPTANGIVERVHQTLGNMLRTHKLEDKELDPHKPFQNVPQFISMGYLSTYLTTLDATPGQVVFGQDMILTNSAQG